MRTLSNYVLISTAMIVFDIIVLVLLSNLAAAFVLVVPGAGAETAGTRIRPSGILT